ncbi:MAG: 30S ribosomal protein S6 [Candidatus Omnitrophica bacterium]|nr:30S ribosomal protein S6 [Candidatus Omnitrophota bacterium]
MNNYEAMIIVKPDLSEEDSKALFSQINDAVTKNNGLIVQSAIWSEKRKLGFPMKKQKEGVYYLVNFQSPPAAIKELRTTYKLNENILRVLITNANS